MKKYFIAVFVAVLMAVCGCTQNNGHIGPVFGSWSLTEISVDDAPLELQGETVFSFQNEVVRVIQMTSGQTVETVRYGNFSLSDDVMSLRFLTELNSDGEGYQFMMPSWLYFPQGTMPLVFEVRTLGGSRMVLALDNEGKTYTYGFSKTW